MTTKSISHSPAHISVGCDGGTEFASPVKAVRCAIEVQNYPSTSAARSIASWTTSRGVPEVRFAFLVTGRYDVVVQVVVRDTQHLKDLALDNFTNRPGVIRIETSIIFEGRRRYELPVFRNED